MNFNEYQDLAARTDNRDLDTEKLIKLAHLINAAMGLSGEAGEFEDRVKKVVFQGHDFEKEAAKLSEELGDILWYAAKAARELDKLLGDVAKANIGKLIARYPQGFEKDRSVERGGYDG
jgi:NTP pyrophosphatase (non-canonical NTP hydrolase)